MMNKTAKTYGGALYDLAAEEQLTDRILADLDLIRQVINDVPDYMKLLLEPSIGKQERKQLMDEAFGGNLHAYTLNFMKLLCDHNTLSLLQDCAKEYTARYNTDHNITCVKVFAAKPLSDDLKEKLTTKLEKISGHQIKMDISIDPTLIGGIRIEMNGKEYDGTARHHLDEIHRILIHPNSAFVSDEI